MKKVGLCHRCGKPAILVCPLCGRVVCRMCYNGQHGVCFSCSEKGDSGFDRRF